MHFESIAGAQDFWEDRNAPDVRKNYDIRVHYGRESQSLHRSKASTSSYTNTTPIALNTGIA